MFKKLLVACVAFALFGCGEDADSGTPAQAGMPGQGGDSAMGGDDTAMGGDDTAMGGQESTLPAECAASYVNARDTGACLSDMDKLALCNVADTIDETMQTCAQSTCIANALDSAPGGAFSQCAAGCVQEQAGFSTDCSACFGDISACTLANCIGSIANPDALNACIAENCDEAFAACAGISLNDR